MALSVTGFALYGQRPETCSALKAEHGAFKEKHNYFSSPRNRATPAMVIARSGVPDDRESHMSGERLVYLVESCAAAFVFDSEGFLYAGAVREDQESAPNRHLVIYERYRAILDKIAATENQLTQVQNQRDDFDRVVRAPLKPSPQEAFSFVNTPVEGDYFLLSNKIPDAIRAYTGAVEADKFNDVAIGRRGMAYHAAGQFKEALADYDAALRLKPREIWKVRRLLAQAAIDIFDDDSTLGSNPVLPDQSAGPQGTSAPASATPPNYRSAPGTEVKVKGHTRKDGTYVPPHTRSRPRK